MICPKCRHIRSENDDPLIPEYQCPKCDVIYAKFKTNKDSALANMRKNRELRKAEEIKSKGMNYILAVVVLLACYAGYAKYSGIIEKENNLKEINALRPKNKEELQAMEARAARKEKAVEVAAAKAKAKAIKAPLTHKQIIEKQFSKWDGSHHKLERVVKKAMHDPSSYDHAETRYGDNGDGTLTVIMKYRGKNAFGGLVLTSTTAKTDINTGTVLAIIQ